MIDIRKELDAATTSRAQVSYLMDLVVRVAAERNLIYEALEDECGCDKAETLVHNKLEKLK